MSRTVTILGLLTLAAVGITATLTVGAASPRDTQSSVNTTASRSAAFQPSTFQPASFRLREEPRPDDRRPSRPRRSASPPRTAPGCAWWRSRRTAWSSRRSPSPSCT